MGDDDKVIDCKAAANSGHSGMNNKRHFLTCAPCEMIFLHKSLWEILECGPVKEAE